MDHDLDLESPAFGRPGSRARDGNDGVNILLLVHGARERDDWMRAYPSASPVRVEKMRSDKAHFSI